MRNRAFDLSSPLVFAVLILAALVLLLVRHICISDLGLFPRLRKFAAFPKLL